MENHLSLEQSVEEMLDVIKDAFKCLFLLVTRRHAFFVAQQQPGTDPLVYFNNLRPEEPAAVRPGQQAP